MINIKYKEEMVYETVHDPKVICFGDIDGIGFKIKSLGSHPTAYVKIPNNSILCYMDYNDIPIDCHGGLTYGEIEEDGYWVGWDYAHYGDYCYHAGGSFGLFEKKYSVDDILADVEKVVEQVQDIFEIENLNVVKNLTTQYKIKLLDLIYTFLGKE